MKTFFEKFQDHELEVDDIYEYISKWHSAPASKSVSEYLGMTKEQYGIFTGEPPAEVEKKFRKPKSVSASKSFLQRTKDKE